jgi:hypothetical protein
MTAGFDRKVTFGDDTGAYVVSTACIKNYVMIMEICPRRKAKETNSSKFSNGIGLLDAGQDLRARTFLTRVTTPSVNAPTKSPVAPSAAPSRSDDSTAPPVVTLHATSVASSHL